MARMGRVVAPGLPHHVTQRGNRHMQTFLVEEDYRYYVALMAEWCGRFNVAVWAYYLALDVDEAESAALRRHERTGRPLGDPSFIERLENQLGRFLRKRKPGPKGPRKTN